jgi:predicted HD phosphohydrolase
MSMLHRVRQTIALIFLNSDETCSELIDTYLTPDQASAFRHLSRHDQAHLCRVCEKVIASGVPSEDLVVAALLHDIGKVSPRGKVRLPDRVAKVVLSKIAPGFLTRLARQPVPTWREGLSLAAHHAELGSQRASAIGCSDRVCWLIAHHEDQPPISDIELCQLVAADHETV